MASMGPRDYVAMNDDALLGDCDVHIYKASGPGGQHRNKVSSAVRLKHRPTGITAHGDGSRSQHENKRTALRRVRMKIACQLRGPLDRQNPRIPSAVQECLVPRRSAQPGPTRRLQIGRKDARFWQVAGFLLDLLEACGGQLAQAAAALAITTSNLAGVLKSEPHVFAAAQAIRKGHGLGPLK